MGRARNFAMDSIRLARGLVRNGGMNYPSWMPLYDRFPPPGLPRMDRDKIPVIKFPQDRLAEMYLDRQENVTDAETAYEFADEQLALIEQGVPEEQAFQMLVKKYETVDGQRLLSKMASRLGIDHVDVRKNSDLADAWAEMESQCIKEALRKKYEEDQEVERVAREIGTYRS